MHNFFSHILTSTGELTHFFLVYFGIKVSLVPLDVIPQHIPQLEYLYSSGWNVTGSSFTVIIKSECKLVKL